MGYGVTAYCFWLGRRYVCWLHRDPTVHWHGQWMAP